MLLSALPQGQLGGSTVALQLFGALGGSSLPPNRAVKVLTVRTSHGLGAFQRDTHLPGPESSLSSGSGRGGLG